MNSTFCKLLTILTVVAASGFAFKGDKYSNRQCTGEDQMPAGYSKTARINVDGDWDFFLTGSFILWQPSEQGCEVAYTSGKLVNMDFDFKPGFKVGLGMNFNHDNWNLYAEYTRLNMTDRKSAHGSAITSPWMVNALASCTSASAKWELDYNMFTLQLARPYYVGTELTFTPHIGWKSGWIDQNYNVDYSATNAPHSFNSNDSWLVGTRAGINTNWMLGRGVRLFGNGALALFYQHFNTETTQYDTDGTYDLHASSKVGHTVPNMELGFGFGWGTYFARNQWHFDVSGAYEYQIYWNQNYMRAMLHTIADVQSEGCAGDLSMQGLTLTFRFDF